MASTSEENSRKQKIRELIEFYFSDSNLRRDGFMMRRIEDSADGHVHFDVLQSFNKVKALHASKDDLAAALRKSTTLIVDESGVKVKRKMQYVAEEDAVVQKRTLYVEGFPNNTTQDDLMRWFRKFPINYVSLPTFHGSSTIRGYAFIEFSSVDALQQAHAAVTDASKFESQNTCAMLKDLRAVPENEVRDIKKRYRDLYDAFRRDGMMHATSLTASDTAQVYTKSKREDASKKKSKRVSAGVVAEVGNIASGTTRGKLRATLEAVSCVAYLDFRKGATKGVVRYSTCIDLNKGCAAFPHMESSDGTPENIYVKKLTADEELSYLQDHDIQVEGHTESSKTDDSKITGKTTDAHRQKRIKTKREHIVFTD